MRRIGTRWVAAMLVSGLGLAARPAAALTITFDEFPLAPEEYLPPGPGMAGYQGLDWMNFGALNPDNPIADGVYETSGYFYGRTSLYNVGLNAFGQPASFSSPDFLFTFNSAYLTAAWTTDLTVDIFGKKEGATLYNTSVEVDWNAPSLLALGWTGIDEVLFVSSGGVLKPEVAQEFYGGIQFAVDDLNITPDLDTDPHGIPEPTTLLLLGAGLVAAGIRSRRRRQR